jgi:hypothetical protein
MTTRQRRFLALICGADSETERAKIAHAARKREEPSERHSAGIHGYHFSNQHGYGGADCERARSVSVGCQRIAGSFREQFDYEPRSTAKSGCGKRVEYREAG